MNHLEYIEKVVLKWTGEDCLIWPGWNNGHGYGKVRLNGKNQYVHRIVCEKANGPAPSSKHHAAHSCGKGRMGCCNPHHVSWKTKSENEMDKIRHGTSNRGDRHGMSKLSTAEVREILSLKGTITSRQIAAKFGVGRSTILAIHGGRRWAWLRNSTPPCVVCVQQIEQEAA